MMKSKRELAIKSPKKRSILTIAKPLIRKTIGTPKSACSGNIKVVVRLRPPNEREQGENFRVVVRAVDDHLIIFDPKEDNDPFYFHGVQQRSRDLLKKANKNMQFVFDRVFDFQHNNSQVFEDSTQGIVTSLMDGYNCSVFAYGATGAGKTHTMLGNTKNPGITFLTMAELFKHKELLSGEREFELGITYLEVYNELVQDLLNPGPPLQVREDSKYGVFVSNLKYHKIDNPDELFHLLAEGNKNRTQHPTDANAESSRSHAVFQVYLKMKNKITGEMRSAKLSMIDLAGSERGSATNFHGARFTEGANINKSLLALGNCINSLADGQRHVPYRDSKLTRLLKDSLGGNCQTVMIANVAPSSMTYEDTYNTLKYASRAQTIKSNVRRNVVNTQMHVEQYVKIVDELNKEVARLKAELNSKEAVVVVEASPPHTCTVTDADPEKVKQLEDLYAKRTDYLKRLYHLESLQFRVNIRRDTKQDSDSRISDLCTTTPDKEEGHRKLGNSIKRFELQTEAYDKEITNVKSEIENIKSETCDILSQHPELNSVAELRNSKLNELESNHKVNIMEMERDCAREEAKARTVLLDHMSKLLKPCYLILKGRGYATDSITNQYNDIIRESQGVAHVTWGDQNDGVTDSGLTSCSSTSTTFPDSVSSSDLDFRSNKRKIEQESTTTGSLNGTFVCNDKPISKVKVCADRHTAKANQVTKKFASTVSPRIKQLAEMRRPLHQIMRKNTTSSKPGISAAAKKPFQFGRPKTTLQR